MTMPDATDLGAVPSDERLREIAERQLPPSARDNGLLAETLRMYGFLLSRAVRAECGKGTP